MHHNITKYGEGNLWYGSQVIIYNSTEKWAMTLGPALDTLIPHSNYDDLNILFVQGFISKDKFKSLVQIQMDAA